MSVTNETSVAPSPASPDAVPTTGDRPLRTAPFRRWVRAAVVGDTLAAAVAAFAAMQLRFGWDDGYQTITQSGIVTISYGMIGALATIAWPLLLGVSGAYELKSSLFGVEELRRIARAGLLLLGSAGMAHIVLRLNLSRGYFAMLLPLTVLLTALARAVVTRLLGRERDDLRNHHRVVVVGPAHDITTFVRDLVRTRTRGRVEVVGYVADDLDPEAPAPVELGHLQRLPDRDAINAVTDRDGSVDLLVRAGRPGPDEMWALGKRASDLGVAVAVAPHRQDSASSLSTSYVPLGTTPLLLVKTPTLSPLSATAKLVFDTLGAALLLLVLSPVFLLIAAAIAVTDGRPVFFRQLRAGRRGAHFSCWKFRTMCPDAEAKRQELLAHNEADGALFKIKDDPRVTRTGRLLRKHSLDELPQLFNVLGGTMSLVGPRPLPLDASEAYDERSIRRLLVKPGMTGLWQVEGRSDLPWDDGVYLDLMYVDQWSPLLDLVILARTLKMVVRPAGAY